MIDNIYQKNNQKSFKKSAYRENIIPLTNF